ncbi:LptA/OstA family protein [Desulfatibacillum aliphaticivorans]|uniref:LptA/OstA family protein n=1 Tax=Desulfatibacillum aliphaticivorans TaxID=218208 RepID=UPI0004158612|nr:LptA/OstA family protein [Desulfatibacillum aliphaticivorans]
MSNINHKRLLPSIIKIFLLTVFACVCSLGPLWADNSAQTPDQAALAGFDLSKGPIKIKAQKLVTNQEENKAWFSMDVVATQGKTTIKANELTIWYVGEKEQNDVQSGLPASQSLKKIQALGNVEIVNEAFTSHSDEALYLQKTGDLVLTGGPAKVVSGKNTVSGEIITRSKDGLLTFEGGVQAEFFPEKSEENKDKPAKEGE